MYGTPPRNFVVTFSLPVDPTSVREGAFTVTINGQTYFSSSPEPSDVNGNTIRFRVPSIPAATPGGTLRMNMAAGAVQSVGSPLAASKGLQAWTADFSFQPAAIAVSKTSLVTREGGPGRTDSFTVRLCSEPAGPVVLGISSDKPAEATVDLLNWTFDASNWNTEKTLP